MFSAGPAPQSSAAPSDTGDYPPWKSDDERYFADQEYSLLSPMSHYPGSLNPFVQFVSDIMWYSRLEFVWQVCVGPSAARVASSYSRPCSPWYFSSGSHKCKPPPQHTIFYTILYTVSYCIRYCILSLHNTIPHSLRHAIQAGPATNSSQTAGQAAGFLRSTSGCGAMGERSPERDAAKCVQDARQKGAETLKHRKLAAFCQA